MAEICSVESNIKRKKEQFVALLTDSVIDIKPDFSRICFEGVNWIQVTQGRVQFRALVNNVPSNLIN
jgi:hypothetical protein